MARTCCKGMVLLVSSLVSAEGVLCRFVCSEIDGMRRTWATVSSVQSKRGSWIN